jgi:hypothetical protein
METLRGVVFNVSAGSQKRATTKEGRGVTAKRNLDVTIVKYIL